MSGDPATAPVLTAPVRTPIGKFGGRPARRTAARRARRFEVEIEPVSMPAEREPA